jgi:hypothetical protein
MPTGKAGQAFPGKKPAGLTGFGFPYPGSRLNWMLTFFNILFRCKLAAAALHLGSILFRALRERPPPRI